RQVAKLEKLGLIIRQHNVRDRRIREAVISRTGKAMTERIDAAREQMGNVVFKDWPQDKIDIFVRLMQKFADAMDSDASMPE
ncbi:MarR family transcriptional regulator, partial [Salmonella enterica subsp. enterica serovar Typhi]|uniref:MarR family winged helix-turn-helix transcriptional regulator n=1 Tax=Salmonella enterica TaxID=28901 RepID=UPI0022CB4424|nr:MarR family transcriptional regulator [Salmonella enterica subsp. enterica serovar Typhi]